MAWENAFQQQMIELALRDEDFEEFHRERSIKQNKITKEEIQQLTICETLTPFERTCHMFRNGDGIQIVFALEHITDFLRLFSMPEKQTVFGMIRDLLTASCDVGLVTTAGRSLALCINGGFIERNDFVNNFFPYTIKSLKTKNKEINEAWLSTLVCSMKILVPNDIEEILDFLEENVSLSQCTITRRSCCKITSHLAEVLPENRILRCLMPKMKALCQDIELDIRSCMCTELEFMVSTVSNEMMEKYILPELLLLFQDEESSVRRVCFSTVTNIMPKINDEFIIKSQLVSLVIKFYEKTLKKREPDNMIIAAQFIGKFFYYLKSFLEEEEVLFFIESFQSLCGCGVADTNSSFCIDNKLLSFSFQSMTTCPSVKSSHFDKYAECRYWCSYNFPAMTSLVPKAKFKLHLHPSFVLLVKDVHPSVRKTMACCFHEIANLLSDEVSFLYNSLKTILKDPDLEVVDSLLTHLPEILDCYLNKKVSKSYVAELVPTLLSCEQEISKSLRWRTHEKFLRGISCLHKHLSSDQIYFKVVPMVFAVLKANKVRPVKLAAARTLLTFIKYNIHVDERNDLCHKIVHEFAESESSRCRIFYIDVCYDVVDIFSKAYFKEHFYNSLMTLATDPVVNVRLKFCKALPLLKSQIKLPSDRLLLQILEQTVRRIMALETDVEISSTIRDIVFELDAIRLPMEGSPQNAEEIADREKELEEERVVENYIRLKHEEHGRSVSLCEKGNEVNDKKRRNRKSGSFSGGIPQMKEISKKIPSKGSLTNSTATNSPKKTVSLPKTKDIPPSKSVQSTSSGGGGSASKLPTRNSSLQGTKRTK